MQFVTSKIKTTPASIEAAVGQKATNRSLDEILENLKGQKQVKTAASTCAGTPIGETEQACMAEPNGVEVEEAACQAAAPGEVEIAAVEPLTDEGAVGLFEDPMQKKEEELAAPLFASKKPMVLKVAKKADFRPWAPEEIVKAWNGYGSQDKCVASIKGQTNDPKAYCYLLQTASEEASAMLKTASAKPAETKVAAPKGMFKKLANLPEDEKKALHEYWTKLYGAEYANAMLENYVK